VGFVINSQRATERELELGRLDNLVGAMVDRCLYRIDQRYRSLELKVEKKEVLAHPLLFVTGQSTCQLLALAAVYDQ